jgi:maleylpyruvate isomerase
VASVDRPTEDIDGCQAAHSRLAAAIIDLPDAVVRQPSLLPDWTVGHVLTHLARNAESMVRRIDAATRGELIDQYAGGARGRDAEIEAGADRPAHELIRDVRDWAQRLDAAFGSLPNGLWNHQVRSPQGDHPIARLPFYRRWEVEVHLVDLGIGPTPDGWTQQLVDRVLPWLIAGLRDRADDRSLMAWMLGRSSPPNLDSWR